MNLTNNIYLISVLFMGLSFLFGSIPFGLIYSRIRGIDIRKVGSGNIGATNVGRQFGFWSGFIPITMLDMFKGMIAIILYRIFINNSPSLFYNTIEILIGVSAVLGHIFSPWIGFKGGKGVATTGGMIFILTPITALSCITIFLLVFCTFGKHIVGRASVIAAIFFPIIIFFIPNKNIPLQIISIFLAIMIILMHKNNIREWISREDIIKKNKSKIQVR